MLSTGNTDTTDLRMFGQAIEIIRRQRRHDVLDGGHPEGKTFTVEELTNLAYPAYQSLQGGRVQHPPARNVVLQIADYLECSLEELNNLLVAANYSIEVPYMEEEQLKPILEIANSIIGFLPFPSIILTRDWNIQGINKYASQLFGMDEALLASIAPVKLNVLHLIFDPELPVRSLLSPTQEAWKESAMRNIIGFRVDNRLCRYERWYQKRVSMLMELPDFASCWRASEEFLNENTGSEMYLTDVFGPGGEVRSIRTLEITLGSFNYPIIASYIPADAQSIDMYKILGLPTPGSMWVT